MGIHQCQSVPVQSLRKASLRSWLGSVITPARKKRTKRLATLRRSVGGPRRFCEASLTGCNLLSGRGNRIPPLSNRWSKHRATMRPEELVKLLRRRPFLPLRLHMTDGQTYDIRHPDLGMVSRSYATISMTLDPETGVLERVEYCSLLHIVRVEELQTAASPSNGSAS